MFSRQIPMADLIHLCRMLKHQLSAGLAIQQVMKQQGERGPRSVRAVAARLAIALEQGQGLADALAKEKDAFPPLFLAMAKLGETTGHLPEIFAELERYYQLEEDLRRQFRSQTFLPIIQFVGAIFLLAGLIWILGFIASMRPGSKPLLTIFGLSGAAGSAAFLGMTFGSFALVWLLYHLLARFGRQKVWMDQLWLRIPVIGPCYRALVMSRLALALQLTLDSGLSITKALRLALSATGNAYFAAQTERVAAILKDGQTLHEALLATGLFTQDFLDLLASAEISGQVPEMMRHQAKLYHEEASQKMKVLTQFGSFGVWGCYAAFMVWAIFHLAGIYFTALGG